MIRRDRPWVVLRIEEGNLWRQITAVVAPTRQAAVDLVIGGDSPYFDGVFKVIPAKAWAFSDVRGEVGQETC